MDWDDWDGWDHMGDWGWGWGATTVTALLLLGLLVLGLVLLARRGRRPSRLSQPYPPPVRSAEQLLAERFARGDIDEQEYRHRLSVLNETRAPTR